ncbi:hypothetical protein [Rhodococcus chondri]|uniref:Histidine kinase n=1 Tax=Rhodococcus chondri TaxID=3065941 RepID=A0ABU7JUC6_9NOCA|nr:hypothetical protein [Rhodococcus sp. CC-R104]MEE2033623.1 hypothetical protein [Rhodococcus sp. CC-R104]
MKQLVAGIAVLMVIGLVVEHWAIILMVIGLVVSVVSLWAFGTHLLSRRRARHSNNLAEQNRLAARADIEHQHYLAGDDRGIYGSHMPADLDGDLRIPGGLRKLPPTIRAWQDEKKIPGGATGGSIPPR